MKLTRPNLIQIVLGALILAIKEKFKRGYLRPPQILGKYTLVKSIKKTVRFKKTAVAVYERGGKLFFIKLWQGRIHDMKYHFLVDEFLSTQNLYKLISSSKLVGLKVPKAIEFIQVGKNTAVVYQYIVGRPLSAYRPEYQARIISQTIKNLNSVSILVDPHTASFPTRHPIVYLLTLPTISLMALIVNPEEIGLILSSLVLAFIPLAETFTSKLVLSHRDLTPQNILISRGKPYLVDCENLSFTVPGYDITYLSSVPGYTTVSNILKNQFRLSASKPLQAYITLQHSLGTKSHAKPYINYLRNLFK